VSAELAGKSDSSGPTDTGVVVTAPQNKVILRQASGANEDDSFIDGSGNVVYGRLTFSTPTWTLSYYVDISGTETAYSFSSSDVRWYYQELFNPMVNPPVYSEFASIPSDNATADVLTATTSIQGKTQLASAVAQSVGASNTAGTANATVANADHAHQGVHSIDGGTTDLYGDITIAGAGGSVASQAGQTITLTSPALASTTPAAIAGTAAVGVGTTSARADHVHEGVHSVSKSGDAQLLGDVTFTGTGAVTLTQVGQNIQISATTGAASPLTTKGDVWGYSTVDARIPIGTDGQVLTADSTQALGLKWSSSSTIGNTTLDSGYTPDACWGTATNVSVFYKQIGDQVTFRGTFKTGTIAASTAQITLPGSFTIDSSKITSTSNVQVVGFANFLPNGARSIWPATNGSGSIFYDGSDTAKVYVAVSAGSTAYTYTKVNASVFMSNNDVVSFEFTVPVT
jgi:hypothetical protein